MEKKTFLIRTVWIVFLATLLILPLALSGAIQAFYHPNSSSSPYRIEIYKLTLLATGISFFVGILVSIFRNRFAARKLLVSTLTSYAAFGIYGVIILVSIDPLPEFFIQHVGYTPYRVPREFTRVQDLSPGETRGLSLYMCIKSLKGVYNPDKDSCESEQVSLSREPILHTFDAQYFFDRSTEFSSSSTVADRIVLKPEATKHQIVTSINNTRAYAVDDKDGKGGIYFEIGEHDNLIRFVDFFYLDSGRCFGEYVSKTKDGTLQFQYRTDRPLKTAQWQEIDQSLLTLISSWKIES